MTSARSRFADLVSGKLGSSRIADTIVFSTEKHIVVPTLGSILPFWFLVIPRLHTLNYAAQPHSTRVELSMIIRKLRSLMKAAEDPLVFEHGPAQPDSVVGCGCDHAHMHVLFAETSQKNKIYKHFEAALSRLPTATRLEAVHSDVDPGNSYYLAWNSGLKLLQQPTQLATPQFFRRLIAGYTGIDNQWDYRKYPFEENIFETLRRVGCHKRAA